MKKTINPSPEYQKNYNEMLANGRSDEVAHFYATLMIDSVFEFNDIQDACLSTTLVFEQLVDDGASFDYKFEFYFELCKGNLLFFGLSLNPLIRNVKTFSTVIREVYANIDSIFIARQNEIDGIPFRAFQLMVACGYENLEQLDRNSREAKMIEVVKEFNSILPHHKECQIKKIDFDVFYENQV